MSFDDYVKSPLWLILVDTVHAMIMYPHHKSYVRDVVSHETQDISAQDLALRLGIPLGEALVTIYELQVERILEKKVEKKT